MQPLTKLLYVSGRRKDFLIVRALAQLYRSNSANHLFRSLVIQHLYNVVPRGGRRTLHALPAVAFIYCDHNKDHTIDDFLGSLLQQLVIQLPISAEVSRWWNGMKQPLTRTELKCMLEAQTASADVYIIVD